MTDRLSIEQIDDMYVVVLRGEWDMCDKMVLRDTLLSLGTQHDVVLDLRDASFFDSSALGELIFACKRVTLAGRRFEALLGEGNVRRLLELSSLDALLAIGHDRERDVLERLRAAVPCVTPAVDA